MTATQGTPPTTQKVFKPTREHILAIVLATGIALMGIMWAPKYLIWLLLIPIVWLAWVLCSSTTVDNKGIKTRYLVRKNTFLPWEDLAGIAFKGTSARVAAKNGTEYPLPGVTFNSLPALAEASGGRITDVIASAEQAADGKYEIIDKDGDRILLTREEYDAYLAEHPDLPGPRPSANEPKE
ncbi:PH domain-containing protein [Corynebacterium coyleae]|uniref:PH domain-containing protein n=1 Tax=Corynebacterium coyleae TaxID=53374 RepID=A0ABX8KWP3_9CORY|nr:PH domain-containing protein [Corynebacterium coyleae]QXB18264.1 PH domain-containing protein [Corynebacterium coyleae]WJY79741.1 Low molecular weight protein antigen 6 [Corynebacterium coyleae]SEB91373.1 PH domain-containing protein [Corynebacterium coyleae]